MNKTEMLNCVWCRINLIIIYANVCFIYKHATAYFNAKLMYINMNECIYVFKYLYENLYTYKYKLICEQRKLHV